MLNNIDFPEIAIKVPYNSEAEQSVIGGLILDSNRFHDVIEHITAEDFYFSSHKIIFEHITAIYDGGGEPEIITICDSLSSSGELSKVGGMAYLAEITNATPSVSNIVSYAKVVKDRARQRSLITAANKITEIAYSPDMTTDEKISESQATLLNMESHDGEEAAQVNSSIKKVIDEIDFRFNNKGAAVGIQTGLKAIDAKIGGIRNQNLFILAARPAMGKTTLAMNIAYNVVNQGKPVLVFSAEMSKEEIIERMVAAVGNLSFSKIRSGDLDSDDWPKLSAGVSSIKDKPLYIDDRGGLTIAKIASTARKQKKINGIELIVIDYLQLLSGKGQSREQEVSAISRGLKSLAKELNIPIIALSQLSRKCEERKDKRPMSSDLRDSGAIEQDADIIAFIYRDEVYDENSERKGIAEVIFTKARNFETGTVLIASRLDVCRFDTLSFEPPPMSQGNTRGGGFNYE